MRRMVIAVAVMSSLMIYGLAFGEDPDTLEAKKESVCVLLVKMLDDAADRGSLEFVKAELREKSYLVTLYKSKVLPEVAEVSERERDDGEGFSLVWQMVHWKEVGQNYFDKAEAQRFEEMRPGQYEEAVEFMEGCLVDHGWSKLALPIERNEDGDFPAHTATWFLKDGNPFAVKVRADNFSPFAIGVMYEVVARADNEDKIAQALEASTK